MTAPVRPCFIQCDWINVEGRLTAHFSGDSVLQKRLDAELTGGPKVHAINATLLYGKTHGVTPYNAKHVNVVMQGQLVPAYDGGKRTTHLWNYGGKPQRIAETFWLDIAEAKRIDAVLRSEYIDVAKWRDSLGDTVFGHALYACPKCGFEHDGATTCPTCRNGRAKVMMQFKTWLSEPTRELRTPFGRRRLYLGRRGESANALTAQLPQSSGASMWYRTLMRLHGFDISPSGDVAPWPIPEGALAWHPGASYELLLRRDAPITVITGTYDSFLVQCPEVRADEVQTWMLWTMEQPWAQLGNKRFPSELALGYNWGEFDDRCSAKGHAKNECDCASYEPRNLDGLNEIISYKPLTAKPPSTLILPRIVP